MSLKECIHESRWPGEGGVWSVIPMCDKFVKSLMYGVSALCKECLG